MTTLAMFLILMLELFAVGAVLLGLAYLIDRYLLHGWCSQ